MTPFVIDHKNPQWRSVLARCLSVIETAGNAGSLMVKVSGVIRSLDQNAKMWPMLEDFARDARILVAGQPVKLDADDWKAILTAAFEGETRMVPGLSGGFVMLGARTSQYTKDKMADFIEFMYAEGGPRGVRWSDESNEHRRKYGRKAA